MTITSQWDNANKTVILTQYQPQWTLEEMDSVVDQIRSMIASVGHTVDVVHDCRLMGFPPNGALWRFRQYADHRNPNQGKVVIVGSTTLTKNIVGALNRIYPEKFGEFDFVFVNSLEEARQVIHEARTVS